MCWPAELRAFEKQMCLFNSLYLYLKGNAAGYSIVEVHVQDVPWTETKIPNPSPIMKDRRAPSDGGDDGVFWFRSVTWVLRSYPYC